MIPHIKTWLLQILGRVLGLASGETRMSFCLALIQSELEEAQAVGEWECSLRLRRRLYRRFVRSWPCMSSGELLRVYGFFNLLSGLDRVEGDIVECGVGRGRSLLLFTFANEFFGLNRRIYGFDSFRGFPPATASDVGARVGTPGPIAGWDDASPELILGSLATDADGAEEKSVMPDEPVLPTIIPGYFRDTLSRNLPERVSFLHLDADLYESTHDALEHCLPRMSPGGIIVFDELHEEDRWPGVRRAMDDLCGPRGLKPAWSEEVQRYLIRIPRA